jgi:hypothetical protein
MKCPNCGTEYSGDFCPGCGAPANTKQKPPDQPPGKQKKPKKPLLKRWWFWAIIAIVIIIIIANSGGGNDVSSANSQETSTAQQTEETATPEPTENLSSIETLYELVNGHYVAGIDIPSGKCNVTAVEGKGNLSSSNLYNGGINEMFGIDDSSDLYTESFNGLKLPEGTTLNISGGLTIQLEYTSIDTGFSGRTYDEDNAITLGTGNYEAGIDFDAGVYKIVAVSGTGNLSSSNIYDGGVNEMFGVDDGSGFYTPEILNVDLPDGTELSVSGGVTVELILAIEN